MEYIPIRANDLIRKVNRDMFLPAIQRELVWEPHRIERLFDSIMSDYPIGTFLFWKLKEENKKEWPIYEFIRDYDQHSPHNQLANVHGITRDIHLVIDGQQRISSLYIGLCGSYRYFYYRWRKAHLYLNLLKPGIPDEENPEELTYQFSFRDNSWSSDQNTEYWYPVGQILDFDDSEDAKSDLKQYLTHLPDVKKDLANKLIGRLHTRIHTITIGNYYGERSQNYEKVLQIFVRANSGGKPLEYSDLLLATATAKWKTLDARSEIHDFTDSINEIGKGFTFGKDFVLKACLYLCQDLPVQYKVKNFTQTNLKTIEDNWDNIKDSLTATVRLISRYGLHAKNVVAPLALLPIAFYLQNRGDANFDTSTEQEDVQIQDLVRKWFIVVTLKRAFGGSSDTTLTRLRVLLKDLDSESEFPADDLYKSLTIEPAFNDDEIDRILHYKSNGRYTNIILSLLYPDKFWKDNSFHIDHIYPRSQFNRRSLRRKGYSDEKVESYIGLHDCIPNLQLLEDSENLTKSATPFAQWIGTRHDGFQNKHLIPSMADYDLDHFDDFWKFRRELIVEKLMAIT